MRPPEEVLRDLVRDWLAKADLDYRAAERLLQDEEPLREIIAFHCQQAAEKYLKACLVRHQVEFPKTHNIRLLLNLAARVSPEMASCLKDATQLTPYGVDVRYPGDLPAVLPRQAVQLMEVTRRVKETVIAHLRPYLTGESAVES
jgi:HEPN domain-containing protein